MYKRTGSIRRKETIRKLLYIEPKGPPTVRATNDDITKRMKNAINSPIEVGTLNGGEFRRGGLFKGWHTCSCGEQSTSRDYLVATNPCMVVTNSLCVHYLQRHRAEVPAEEIEFIKGVFLKGE